MSCSCGLWICLHSVRVYCWERGHMTSSLTRTHTIAFSTHVQHRFNNNLRPQRGDGSFPRVYSTHHDRSVQIVAVNNNHVPGPWLRHVSALTVVCVQRFVYLHGFLMLQAVDHVPPGFHDQIPGRALKKALVDSVFYDHFGHSFSFEVSIITVFMSSFGGKP